MRIWGKPLKLPKIAQNSQGIYFGNGWAINTPNTSQRINWAMFASPTFSYVCFFPFFSLSTPSLLLPKTPLSGTSELLLFNRGKGTCRSWVAEQGKQGISFKIRRLKNYQYSGTKIQPKEEVFGRISLRASGQKLRSGPRYPEKKTSILG